jgi:hypothetical protein
MKFGTTDRKLNKRLREIIHAEDSPLYDGPDASMEAFEALAKNLRESHLIPARAVHDNCDGTARQCAAYFFGLRDGAGGVVKPRVATATCRDSRRLKRPPRLYILVRDGVEEYLFAHIRYFLDKLRTEKSDP